MYLDKETAQLPEDASLHWKKWLVHNTRRVMTYHVLSKHCLLKNAASLESSYGSI